MGFIKDAKASTMAGHAKRAMDEGHTVFVVRIQAAWSTANRLSGPMEDTAEQVEAIERQGWVMDRVSYVMRKDDKPEGIYLFRRPAGPAAGRHGAPGEYERSPQYS